MSHVQSLTSCACNGKDPAHSEQRERTRLLMNEFNSSTQDETQKRELILKDVFGKVGDDVWLEPPIYCEYGKNTTFGNKVYFNVCCVIMDECPVTVGDYVLFGPAVQLGSPDPPQKTGSTHSKELSRCSKSIEIGSDVWIGGGAKICCGVKIGRGSVIGAGSVVTEDVPPNVLAVGNPCCVIKEIIQIDKYLPVFPSLNISEKVKMLNGQMYNPADPQLLQDEHRCRNLIKSFNDSNEDENSKRLEIIQQLFGSVGENSCVEPPFYCDYGSNTTLGNNVFIGPNCVILDVCAVTIGDNVILGPSVQVYPVNHPILAAERRSGLEFGRSVEIGSDVWIGGGAIICPGVRIESGSVIGAGSVVTKDIPPNVFAVGNPCRVVEEFK